MTSIVLEVHTTPSGQKFPVNSEENRMELSRAHRANGYAAMTPAMCGFWLQAMALDKSSDAFKRAQTVAHRLHATYEGMSCDFAIASSMRIKVEQPAMFREMAVVRCPCCNGTCHIVKD